MYEIVIKEASHLPTLLEWDEEIPKLEELVREAQIAKVNWGKHHGKELRV